MNYFRYANLWGKLLTNNIELKNPKCDLDSGAIPNCLNQTSRPANKNQLNDTTFLKESRVYCVIRNIY